MKLIPLVVILFVVVILFSLLPPAAAAAAAREPMENPTKYHFLTFGGGSDAYHDAVARLIGEARAAEVFDSVVGHTDAILRDDAEFWPRHGDFIEKNKRGYGYWIWKPYVILRRLREIGDGDILVYCDAGCSIEPAGAEAAPAARKLFDLAAERDVLYTSAGHNIETYTKMDTLKYFGAGGDDAVRKSEMPQACIIVVKNSRRMRDFMEEWYATAAAQNYHLVDDTVSVAANVGGFIENRHDQSILALLVHKYGWYSADRFIERRPFVDARRRSG